MYAFIIVKTSELGILFLLATVLIWFLKGARLPKPAKTLGSFLLISLIIQLTIRFTLEQGINMLPLLHLHTLLEFIFFTQFFAFILDDSHGVKKNVKLVLIIGICLLLLDSLAIGSLYQVNTYGRIALAILMLCYGTMHLKDVYGKVDLSHPRELGISLIVFSVLISYSGSLTTYLLELFTHHYARAVLADKVQPIWLINGVLTAFFQLFALIAYSVLAFKQTEKISLSPNYPLK
ncbi:MAG: hypothetical protein AAFY71_04320 [Bacteroidota bacterium]